MNDITLPWVRLSADKGDYHFGDDNVGEYDYSSIYGVGDKRCEVIYYLAAVDMNEPWSEENLAYPMEVTCTYTVSFDDDGMEVATDEEYLYEECGIHAYPATPEGKAAAYRELDRLGVPDLAWAFTELTFEESQSVSLTDAA